MQGSELGLHQQLKTDKPLELEPIIVKIASANKSQVLTPDLEDTKKRWLVVGICLQNVLTPVLRQYVSKSMTQIYKTLIQAPNNIDTQCYQNYLELYQNVVLLNYEAVNNNKIVRSGKRKDYKKYDYKIQNHVDFSKLFLSTSMAQYVGFDETCDSSALLTIIMCSDRSRLGGLADQLRTEVRNPWAHCNFNEWETIKYLSSIRLMKQFIKHLHIPSEVQALDELTHWEVNGINFLQGTRLGLEVVDEVNKHIQSLAQYVLQFKDDSSSYSDQVHDSLVLISNDMSNACQRMDQIDRDISHITVEVSSLRLKTVKIEQTVNENVQDIKDIKDDIENIKRCNSHLRPKEKVFFYPPDRLSVFIGREDKLSALEMKFLEKKDIHHIEVICGLGGCGKTSLSIEFAWMFQQFYRGGIFWVSAESNVSLNDTITTLAVDINQVGQTGMETFKRTLTWLSRLEKRWLLVIDNADTDIVSGQLNELLLGTWKRDTRGHIIITTRREPLTVEETLHIGKNDCNYLETLNEEEGVQFMIKRTGMFDEGSNESISKLVNELGGLPLALEQAAALIKCTNYTFKGYLDRFEKKRLKLLKKTTNPSFKTHHNRLAVTTTWLLNIEYIRSQSQHEGLGMSAVVVMEVASFLFADDMPIGIFNSGEPAIGDEEACETLSDQFAIRQVLEILTRFSLFQRYRSGSLSVHRLVQEVIRSRLQEDEKHSVLRFATRMINKALISTTAPHTVICKNERESHACRGLLSVWSKLAANANALKIHLTVSKESEENKDLFVSLESVRIMQASAIYNSLFQRQDVALRDQKQMLNIIASLDLDKDTCRELTNIKVPLLERDRIRIQNSIATVLQIDDNENQIKSAANIPLSTESLRVFGNQAFKEERYKDALQYYTEALRACSKNTYDQRILSNRSLVYLKLHEYTYALNDANACIEIDPSCWKAHVWKSYAIAELTGTDKLLPEMEGSGRSSACIASFLKKECLLEYKMKVNYPILLYKIIDGENLYNNLRDRIMSIVESPFTTYMLKKGRYIFTQLLKTLKSCQVIGVEPGVEIDIGIGIYISRPLDADFNINFEREREITVHFENISFFSKNSQVRVEKGGIASFYRCSFSNQFPLDEAKFKCDENIDLFYPMFLRIINNIDKNFISSITSLNGGKIVLNACEIRSDGGCGLSVQGENSHLAINNCNVHKSLIGIAVGKGGTMEAFDNQISNNTLHGIAIGPNGNATLKRNSISQNKAEGIWGGGNLKCKEINSTPTSVTAVDNIILQNGLSGICLEGGTFELKNNLISENWAWGIFIHNRSSLLAENNEISNNKCGGIRVGINYSASVYIDGNTIKDHSGPDIVAINESTYMMKAEYIDEVEVYSTQPFITDRNLLSNNNKPVQSPRDAVKSVKTCCWCQKMSSKLKACGKCRIDQYCSKECQKNHWVRHKHMCSILSDNYTIEIQIKDTKPNKPRLFHSSLIGICEGHKPDVVSTKKFIVKVQSDHYYVPYDPRKSVTLYDQSVTLNLIFSHPELYHLCSECGRLSGDKTSSKKIFCLASYKQKGEILCIHTDEFPDFQTW
ncbi:unnamed protein product [Mytilus coruscus]|uniref:MYND-type domain-containing protein n=1 Tax=Mytilus coruscus TaxID=42192 RepID=A0A6J8BT97_MYTCO|nr:unnamed protein product [Mytilus coruscus]